MRYILSDAGYIDAVSFGAIIECKNKTCTEYTGTVPSGYESLCEWSDNANIRAYKIVDGNLLFDEEEDARLQEEYNELAKTYSTVEKKIGTWIDGKPLYQKVFQFTDTISNNTSFAHDISDVETIWVEKAFMQNMDSNKMSYTLPITYYGANLEKDELSIYVDETNFVYKVQTAWGYAWTKYVVLNYTKTTD